MDGFRIDVADGLVKAAGLPEVVGDGSVLPYSDQDGVHDIYRSWRAVADSYPGERVFVGEMWLPDPVRFARYLRPDELHSAFNFDFLSCPWDVAALRGVIDATKSWACGRSRTCPTNCARTRCGSVPVTPAADGTRRRRLRCRGNCAGVPTGTCRARVRSRQSMTKGERARPA